MNNMEELVKLQVLWVDDQPQEAFMNEAFDLGLDITPANCVTKGVSFLNDK